MSIAYSLLYSITYSNVNVVSAFKFNWCSSFFTSLTNTFTIIVPLPDIFAVMSVLVGETDWLYTVSSFPSDVTFTSSLTSFGFITSPFSSVSSL